MYANRRNLIESLEPRRLLSTLNVSGVSGPDDIAVWVPGDGQLHVRVGAGTTPFTFPEGTYSAVHIETFGGSDTISIAGTGTTLVSVYTGDGDDQIFVTGRSAGRLSGIDATLLVDGGADRDVLIINDFLQPVSPVYDIDVAGFGASFMSDLSLLNIERFDLYAGPGGSHVRVNSTGPNTQWFIHGNTGGDLLDVNSLTSSLDLTQGEIHFVGGGGTNDQVYVYDAAPAAGRHYVVRADGLSEVTGTFGGLFLDSVERAQLSGGRYSDTFDLQSSLASTPWEVFGNEGDDVFLVNNFNNLDSLQGHITLHGGAWPGDFNELLIFDALITAADPYTITPTTVSRPFFGGLTYGEMNDLWLRAQPLANVITVEGTSCPVVIDGAGGDDKIHVQETSSGAPVYVLNSAGLDSVAVNEDATGNATVLFPDTMHLNDLFVNSGGEARMDPSGSRVLCAKTLTINGTGALDLNDNDLLVTDTPRATIESYIRSAYDFGAWDGPGIYSFSALTNPSGNTTLGLLSGQEFNDNHGGLFDGQVVNNSDVVVKYTYYGDVDFNGAVDASDYNLIDFGFANHFTGWGFGDADYSGGVDVSDYNLIDFAFASQTGVL